MVSSNNPFTSLQELASKQLLTIPECYCVNHQPPISLDDQNNPNISPIPLLNMATLTSQELFSTCKEWGIFQLVNHGVNSSLIEKLKYEIEKFYKLPIEEKMKYKLRPGEVEGYGQTILRSADQKIDWADRFFMIINPLHLRKSHLLPELPSSLRETLEAYIQETEKLGMNLLKMMGETLRIDKEEIGEMFEDGLETMRMTFYPPCPKPELVMGLTPHSDATGITILLQVNGVEGLQVKKDGVWLPVKILPEALVVNVGDVLEILSNGIFKSIEHRAAVNSEKERMSIAMFYSPKLEVEIGPLSCLIDAENPPLYKRIIMEKYVKDFFTRKLNGKSYLDAMKINN
ncbi:hypothetical protein M9H77_11101 [Catharanthus roseus]|uniref:Uncharacterized protein n=1 Tax=Catharanthus roseus TaxID=4058 RepID=A0ACC0BDR9_CATRO|nr:hypothetical protein M9H77_11101 [Catharanthus roseus]